MHSRLKSWALTFVKIAIAVVGLWWVISQTHIEDRATITRGRELKAVKFLEPVPVDILETKDALVAPNTIMVRFTTKPVKVELDGKELTIPLTDAVAGLPPTLEIPRSFLEPVKDSQEPKIEIGLKNLVKKANVGLLILSWAILGIPFLVTAWRWKKLMEPQGIQMPYHKCLALTFVGQFYSTFLPGTVSGDLVKIIYTSRVVGSKTKSTVTVLLDRVIGLVALMVVAGIAAAFQFGDSDTMKRVLLFVAAALIGLILFALIYFSHRMRRVTGLQALLNHKFVPDFVRHADEVMHVYRKSWQILVWAFGLSLIAQTAMPASAWLAGMAFHINNAHAGQYFAYTPLAILAAALPISFLGLGVMDSVLLNFFFLKGLANASQTFALAQSIRFFPILWNMCGAFWVVTGKYSRKVESEEVQ